MRAVRAPLSGRCLSRLAWLPQKRALAAVVAEPRQREQPHWLHSTSQLRLFSHRSAPSEATAR